MSADVSLADIPVSYWFYPQVSGSLDVDLDNVHVKELPKIVTENTVSLGLDDIHVKELPVVRLDGSLSLGLDNIQIKQLPKIELGVGLKPTRVHFPSHYKFCASLFGFELFSYSLCGESMMITEPYSPHQTEICDDVGVGDHSWSQGQMSSYG